MSGYAIQAPDPGGMGPVLKAATEDFYGKPVRIAFPPGDEPRMSVSDAINALGKDSFIDQKRLAGFLYGSGRLYIVELDGSVESLRMATREDIFNLILSSHSSKLDTFRAWASKVLSDVVRQGYHVDPRLASQGMPGDPFLAALDAARRSYLMAREANQKSEANAREIEVVKDRIGRGPSHWCVAAWLADHGIKATVDAIKEEGMRLSRICKQMGFIVPEDKVSNGSDFPARRWPIEAINIWWPDFKRRFGID